MTMETVSSISTTSKQSSKDWICTSNSFNCANSSRNSTLKMKDISSSNRYQRCIRRKDRLKFTARMMLSPWMHILPSEAHLINQGISMGRFWSRSSRKNSTFPSISNSLFALLMTQETERLNMNSSRRCQKIKLVSKSNDSITAFTTYHQKHQQFIYEMRKYQFKLSYLKFLKTTFQKKFLIILMILLNTSSFLLLRILHLCTFTCLHSRCIQNRRLFTTLLSSFLIFIIFWINFIQLHLIQIFKVLTNGLQFFIFNAYKICHFCLHFQGLWRLPTIVPQKVHLLSLKACIAFLSQFFDQRQQVLRNLTGPLHHFRQIFQLPLNKFIDIGFQSFESVTVIIDCRGKLFSWFFLFEHPANELFEAYRHELVLVILVTVYLLARLVVALQTEKRVLLAALVETHHPRLFFVDALWEVFHLDRDVSCRTGVLLFFHSNQYFRDFIEFIPNNCVNISLGTSFVHIFC